MANKKRKRSLDDVMLVPVDRRRRRRILVYTALFMILLPVVAFFGGAFYSQYSVVREQVRNEELTQQVQELKDKLQSARDDLAVQRTDSQVSQQAQEQVRAEIKDLRDQLAELNEAVAFYKGVMAPNSDDKGLHIERLDIAATTTPGVFSYRLVLTQLGDNRNRRYLSGNVTFFVTGNKGEQAVRLNGSEVLADGAETRFQFRYFQELTGKLTIPDGMDPDQLTIEAASTGRRQEKVERNFIWQVQETNSAGAG